MSSSSPSAPAGRTGVTPVPPTRAVHSRVALRLGAFAARDGHGLRLWWTPCTAPRWPPSSDWPPARDPGPGAGHAGGLQPGLGVPRAGLRRGLGRLTTVFGQRVKRHFRVINLVSGLCWCPSASCSSPTTSPGWARCLTCLISSVSADLLLHVRSPRPAGGSLIVGGTPEGPHRRRSRRSCRRPDPAIHGRPRVAVTDPSLVGGAPVALGEPVQWPQPPALSRRRSSGRFFPFVPRPSRPRRRGGRIVAARPERSRQDVPAMRACAGLLPGVATARPRSSATTSGGTAGGAPPRRPARSRHVPLRRPDGQRQSYLRCAPSGGDRTDRPGYVSGL